MACESAGRSHEQPMSKARMPSARVGGRSVWAGRCRALAEVGLADRWIGEERAGIALKDQDASLEDVAAGGDREGQGRVLLDHEDAHPLAVDLDNQIQDALDDDR